jgi:hypothetical protein
MTAPQTRQAGPAPEDVLGEGLSDWLCRPVRVVAMVGRPLETSSHPISRLRVTLSSGEQLSVIYKRPRPGHALYGNEREVLVYRRLLSGRRFGAPALYGSAYEPGRGRYWLFLEDVGETTLEQEGEDAWLAAARWLAGLHGAYLGRAAELRALGCLGEHDADYYRLIARTAREHLVGAGAASALGRFDRLTADFDSVADYLAAQPRTLVHGDVFAGNLVVQPGPRVRALDWESAAVGLAAWDLTRLLDGWPEEAPFLDAYLAELARHTAAAPDEHAFRRTLAHCRFLSGLWHLRWSGEACRNGAFVEGLLRHLEAARRRPEQNGEGS